jgi:hypothetical protein
VYAGNDIPPSDTLMKRRINGDSLSHCWQSNVSTQILIGSSAKLSEDIIYQFPLLFIPDNSWKLETKYSVLVKQRALSKGAYEYLENMKKNSEQLGSIFDPQPSTNIGNIYCATDANEIVLGFIYSSTSVEKRIFITRSQVPDWEYRFMCEDISVSSNTDSLVMAFGSGTYIPTYDEYDQFGILRYRGASRYCVDCRLRGVHEKPDFW